MVDSVGNVVQAPSFGVTAATTDDEILFSTAGFTQIGVTLKPGKGVLAAGTLLARVTSTKLYVPYVPATSEVQTVALTVNQGQTLGGTFTLTFDGETTGAIAYDANAAAVKAALEATASLNPGDITVVAGQAANSWVITFGGRFAGTDVAALTGSASSLTGTGAAVGITTGTAGGAVGSEGAGSETVRGVLRHAVDTGASGATTRYLGNLVVAGILKYDKLVGVDSIAISTLNARVDSINNVFAF